MNNISAKSILPLIIGGLSPIIAVAVPAIQPVIQQNFWLALLFSAGLSIWNHFTTPVSAAPAPVIAVKL
jgi:hypothetical protein